MVLELMHNVALLVALAVGLQILARRMEDRPALYGLSTGLLFGVAGIVGMMTPMHFAPGVIYDGRSIVLSLAGLFGGPLAAAVSAVMCGAYRLHLGGAGATAGLLTVIEAAALGTILHYLRRRHEAWVSPAPLWAFGLLVHVIMLALQFLIPNVGWDVLRRIGPSVLIFYPLGFLLIAQVFLNGEERRKAEQALRQSEERYRRVSEDMPVLICRFLPGGEITYANEAYCKYFGKTSEALVGSSFLSRVHEADRETVMRAISSLTADSPTESHEHRVIAPNGEIRWQRWTHRVLFDAQGPAVAYQSVGEDITDRMRAEAEKERLEAQVRHAQKLESLGVLAGGIAHDFNNLLVGILGNADLAMMDLPPTSPARASIEQVRVAARRAAELTTQMLAYSGKGAFVIIPVDLSKIIREMMGLLRSSISKKVTVQHRLSEDLPSVQADVAQVRQVIMNLIINASEAIGDKEGVITVSTGVMHADRRFLAETHMGEDLPEGRYVYLEVSDTGTGMDAETKSKVFDPFFSTKFTGRGLGLAATLGVIRGHRAAIKVESELGRGTTFTVLLPSSDEPAVDVSGTISPQNAGARGSGTILVVDDEEQVLRVAQALLERAGYSVLTAGDGRAAVRVFREHAGEIAAVLLDLTMPELNGDETFNAIRHIRPDARVILSSGYSQQEATKKFAGKDLSGFIQKPYVGDSLVQKISEVLSTSTEVGG
ncbi:MAG: PAS domain S-box protein [Phycisphaerae bacterium]|nr:PAS domain S-box protein [Phycisphaerae bacterium]